MTLTELLRLLKHHRLTLIAIPLACAIVCGAVCWLFLPNQYTTSASFYVLAKNTTQATSENNITSGELTTSQQIANDIAVLIESQSVIDAAAAGAGLENLDDYATKVENRTDNRIISLKVTGPDPLIAAKVADSLASATSAVALQIMELETVNIVDRAKVPTEPSGPPRLMYTGVAFLAGLFIALVIIISRDAMSTAVRSARELEQKFGLPNMGQIPFVKGMR